MHKTISSEITNDNGFWKYRHDKYALPNGKERDYYYVETRGNVIVIPVLDDGGLVLVRQHRYITGKPSIEFPGGGIADNETPLGAAKRELLEETGYESSDFIMVGAFEPDIGLCKNQSHVFIANELTKTAGMDPGETENIEILSRRPDEFNAMIKRGEIMEGRMLASWAIVRDKITGKFSS